MARAASPSARRSRRSGWRRRPIRSGSACWWPTSRATVTSTPFDGAPYFDLTSLTGDGVLDPGETTTPRAFTISDPVMAPFTFHSVVMAVPPGDSGSTSTGATTNPQITLSEAEVEAGSSVTVSVAGGPGGLGDWIGLFAVGAPDGQYLDWSYLDGTRSGPASSPTGGTVTFRAPSAAGQYEFRLFSRRSYTQLGVSDAFSVTGGDLEPPTAPTILGFGTDTGELANDRLTRDTTPTFTWAASSDLSGILGYWWAIDDDTPETGGTFTTDLNATAVLSADGPHTFSVRAVDASPNANLGAVASRGFTIDTRAPRVVSLAPADGASLASGPQVIEVRFSEAMDRSAGQLAASDLVLSGAGVGQASLADAVWLDDHTAQFRVIGAWGVGPVTLEWLSGSLQDRAGNPVVGQTARFTIEAAAPTSLAISASQVNAGAAVTVTLRNGPGQPEDRLGLYAVGAPDDQPLDWFYLDGTDQAPQVGIRNATWTFVAPLIGGADEFRLISAGTRVATTPTFVVSGIEIFLDFDGGFLPDLPGVVEVGGSTGRTHDGFVAYGGLDRDVEIQQILAAVSADFADLAVPIIRNDNWQTDPRFGPGDTVILVGGQGTWVAGSNPTVTSTSVRWVAGIAPWDPGNVATNVAFAFADATAEAFQVLGRSAAQIVQQVANTISHEIGHTFGLDHVTQLNGTQDLMGTAETGTQISGDGSFSDVVLPRQHGGAYSSHAYLLTLFGMPGGETTSAAGAGGLAEPLVLELPRETPFQSEASQGDSSDLGDPMTNPSNRILSFAGPWESMDRTRALGPRTGAEVHLLQIIGAADSVRQANPRFDLANTAHLVGDRGSWMTRAPRETSPAGQTVHDAVGLGPGSGPMRFETSTARAPHSGFSGPPWPLGGWERKSPTRGGGSRSWTGSRALGNQVVLGLEDARNPIPSASDSSEPFGLDGMLMIMSRRGASTGAREGRPGEDRGRPWDEFLIAPIPGSGSLNGWGDLALEIATLDVSPVHRTEVPADGPCDEAAMPSAPLDPDRTDAIENPSDVADRLSLPVLATLLFTAVEPILRKLSRYTPRSLGWRRLEEPNRRPSNER